MSTSNDLIKTTKTPWNQIFMHYDYDGQKYEDYKISSSLKTIWNDASDNKTINSNQNADNNLQRNAPEGSHFMQACSQPRPESVQYHDKNMMDVRNGVQSKLAKPFGSGSDNNAMVKNVNQNVVKGRAITSRNGGYSPSFGIENQQSYSSSMSGSISHQQSQSLEAFLQKVQVIVNNGFLDPKILNEPISPETFDLVQMLIYYVMEYKQTRNYANCDNSPALCAEIKNIFYKINLIQNEIAKCQLQFVQQKRIQHEILQSFSTLDTLVKQQNIVGQSLSNQRRQPMATYGNGQRSQVANNINSIWPNPNGNVSEAENYDRSNQRFNQRTSFDQFAQSTNPQSTGKFAFLPKAKNVDKRSHFDEQNRYYSQRDGNFTTN